MTRLWLLFAFVMITSFAVLSWIGTRIYQEAPPISARVVTTHGCVVIDTDEVGKGQNVWQTMGGMEVGSIWGHGSSVAPDWTADWLHREARYIADHRAQGVWATRCSLPVPWGWSSSSRGSRPGTRFGARTTMHEACPWWRGRA